MIIQTGALGFLGGSTVEKESTPNIGLWDQRAVLEWIQKYIGILNGDPEQVTVWGLVC
jgi:carboxylesterase type B